jgi:hypothetical protein
MVFGGDPLDEWLYEQQKDEGGEGVALQSSSTEGDALCCASREAESGSSARVHVMDGIDCVWRQA